MASTVDSTRVREFNEENDPFFQKKLDRLAKMVTLCWILSSSFSVGCVY